MSNHCHSRQKIQFREKLNFTPLNDMIVVKPDPEEKKTASGLLFLPDGSMPGGHKPGSYRDTFVGAVVAVGRGDRHVQFEKLKCSACGSHRYYEPRLDGWVCNCAEPDGFVSSEEVDKWNKGRYPMEVKVGDRVVYPRRPNSPAGTHEGNGETGIVIDGEKYLIFNEEQSALAVIEE